MKHRTDENHAIVLATLEQCGYSVLDTSRLGDGAPDALIGYAGIDVLIEIKNPDSGYGKRGLQSHQREWAEAWRGRTPLAVYRAEEVVAEFNRLLAQRARSA